MSATVTKLQTARLPVTEDSLAVVFANEYEDSARYDHHTGRWYVWDGSRWRHNQVQLPVEWARGICRRFGALDTKLGKVLGKSGTISGIERLARADPRLAVTSEVFDRDPWLLGTPSGTVDLRTGATRAARPPDMITKAAGVAPAPERAVPTRWLQFLNEATGGDAELIQFLKTIAGYCLTGMTNEHALVFVYGPGGNGKTVFLNTLSYILGDYATTAPMETFTAAKNERHPTDLAMLQGARMVSAAETEEGRAWAESRIKALTGGDEISARFMRQDFFTFRPTFKLLIIGNHKPVLRNVDEAARRRFRLVPFTIRPATPDPHLETRLRAEAPAILRWAIEGCLEWQQFGLARPAAVERETTAYFADQDTMRQWAEECCDVDRAPISPATQSRSLSSKLYGSWADWCKRNGEEAGTNKRFSQDLERRGFLKKPSLHGKEFLGIRIRNRSESDER